MKRASARCAKVKQAGWRTEMKRRGRRRHPMLWGAMTAVVPMDAAAVPSEERNSLMSDRPGPKQDASDVEMRRLVEARIDALPDSYRTVFVLRALEELTVEETAGVLEIPEATVRTRFFRARALLRSEERRVGKECRSRWWP